ncbi:MAG: repair protein RecO [Bacteroidetes bacterium]|jgi:DNA repair protein RecO (recombination protein O)|nr:repair protein RecO [Bacteroidota bacterium]
MLQKTSGIVLHTVKYSETSLIVKIYTRSFGLQSYIISGVRNKKSRNKASLFQPLTIVDIEVSGNEKSALQRITEINLNQPYSHLPYDVIKSSIGMFINEMILHSFKEPHPDEDLFLFVKNSLLILDLSSGTCANFHLGFLIQLSRFLGFSPHGEFNSNSSVFDLQEGKFVNYIPHHPHYLTASLSEILYKLIMMTYEEMEHVKISKAERKLLLNALVQFFQLHISSFGMIKSVDILSEIVEG